jgi:plastocyanin
MKKIYSLLLITLLTCNSAFSTVHVFDVNSSDFSPFSLAATIGDTIRWVWTGGTHNTVSGSIPSGAAAWNSPISSSVTQYDYVPTVDGIYLFACTIHSFYGQFSVALPNAINSPIPSINFLVSAKENSNYTLTYRVLVNSKVDLSLTDMTGKVVRILFSGEKQGGEYVENYFLEDLKADIYFLQMSCDNRQITRRIFVE